MVRYELRYETLEAEANALKEIAAKFAPDSPQFKAIEHAAFALNYVITQDFERFSAFVRQCGKDLTPDQKTFLSKLGLEFD